MVLASLAQIPGRQVHLLRVRAVLRVMLMVTESATFVATLPPLLSAIRISGDGGCRIMLDIPETEMGEAMKLLLWREQALRITVAPEEEEDAALYNMR